MIVSQKEPKRTKNEIGKAKERFDKSKSVSDKAKELCSHIVDEVKGVCSYVSDNTCGDGSNAFTLKIWQCSEYKSRVWQGRR